MTGEHPSMPYLAQLTSGDGLIVPGEMPDSSGAVWRRDGRCEQVLAELFDLQEARPQ